jgi:DNA polymerase
MRLVISALADELRRLKAAGVSRVAWSDEAVAALRRAVPAPASPKPRSPAARPAAPSAAALPAPPAFELPPGEKAARWAALRGRVLNDPVCLAHVRPGKKVVLGVGSLDARIMFVGEAPGAEEEDQGEPFVGPAGRLLNRMIAGMGLRREDVYIGNIMNWRPELPAGPEGVQYGNRPPTAGEMAYCLPYLRAQVQVVDPAILVALGATAAQGLLGPGTFKALGEVRGQWRQFAQKPLMITYHPSYILRNATNRSKRLIWEDLLKVMTAAGLPVSERQQGYFLDK